MLFWAVDQVEVSRLQRHFLKFSILTFVDFIVLGLFSEFWVNVYVDSFSIGLLSAFTLQILLSLSISLESRIKLFVNRFTGKTRVLIKILLTWMLLFFSKVIMLEIIDFAFGNYVEFSGNFNGLITFIFVVLTMIVTEAIIRKLYLSLNSKK